MTWDEAELLRHQVAGLRECEGWAHVLRPRIEARIQELELEALRVSTPDTLPSRHRRSELLDLLDWLDDCERNAEETMHENRNAAINPDE